MVSCRFSHKSNEHHWIHHEGLQRADLSREIAWYDLSISRIQHADNGPLKHQIAVMVTPEKMEKGSTHHYFSTGFRCLIFSGWYTDSNIFYLYIYVYMIFIDIIWYGLIWYIIHLPCCMIQTFTCYDTSPVAPGPGSWPRWKLKHKALKCFHVQ